MIDFPDIKKEIDYGTITDNLPEDTAYVLKTSVLQDWDHHGIFVSRLNYRLRTLSTITHTETGLTFVMVGETNEVYICPNNLWEYDIEYTTDDCDNTATISMRYLPCPAISEKLYDVLMPLVFSELTDGKIIYNVKDHGTGELIYQMELLGCWRVDDAE